MNRIKTHATQKGEGEAKRQMMRNNFLLASRLHTPATCKHAYRCTHTHTQIRSCLFRWRLDVAYLRAAAVCGYMKERKGGSHRRIYNFLFLGRHFSEKQLMIWFSGVTHSQWAGYRQNLRAHTFHMALLLCFGDSCVDSYTISLSERISLFLWVQKHCTALPKQQKRLAPDQS